MVHCFPENAGKAGDTSIFFEAVPDFSITAYSVRVCAIRIHEVGEALPCVHHSNQPNDTGPIEVYSKSDASRPFNDYASVEVGRTCPLQYPGAGAGSSTFRASLYMELPPNQSGLSSGTFELNAGLRLSGSSIWVSSRNYTIQTSDYSGAVIEAANSSMPVEPFVTAYPFITTKDRADPTAAFHINEPLFIKYVMKLQPTTRGDYKFVVTPPPGVMVCKLDLIHIGENMPCTEKPPVELTGNENTILTYGTPGGSWTPELEHACGEPAQWEFKVSVLSFRSLGPISGILNRLPL